MAENKENYNHEEIVDEVHDEVPEVDLEDTEVRIENKLKTLRQKLSACDEEKRQYLEDLQRTKAEFLNSKRRLEKEKEHKLEQATNKHILQLLPLYDSFIMAMGDEESWSKVDNSWRAGIESIYGQLNSILDFYQVERINQTGVDFDPNLHEAMEMVAVDNPSDKDKVIAIIQTGFIRKKNDDDNYLIRPARVKVGADD